MLRSSIYLCQGVSVLLFGLMAGFFATYSYNVNFAMLDVSGDVYARVQSLFNLHVRHTGFFLCFFGASALPIITAILMMLRKQKGAYLWGLTGALYLFGIVLFTKFINLPLNYYTESWDPAALPQDWQAIRHQWNQANLVRTWLSIGLFCVSIILLSLPKKQA